MARYQCVQRLTIDGGKTVHEVGEIVELSDADAQVALRLQAVVPVQETVKQPPPPAEGEKK